VSTPAFPSVVRSLAASARLLRARPLASLALGIGVALSLLSVCCGIGVVVAPWLLCELLALQLSVGSARPIERSAAWLWAGLVMLGAVLLVASVGWLAFLGLGTQPLSIVDAPVHGALPWAQVRSGGAWLAAGSALVGMVFVLPFLYAPLILLRARTSLGTAVLESARLVRDGGAARHLLLSLGSNVVQASPLLAAAASATWLRGSDSGPVFMVASLPLLALSVPLGQGMVVTRYAATAGAGATHDALRCPPQPAARLPWPLIALWIAIVAAPVLSFAMVGASLVRPSRLAPGRLGPDVELLASVDALDPPRSLYPEGTALEVVVSAREVIVRASDGGGAGRLPLPLRGRLSAARIARVRDRFGIEVTQAGQPYTTFVDRAGVRLDDDLHARLFDRVPAWAVLMMLVALLVTAAALLPVLAALGDLRAHDATQQTLGARRERTLRWTAWVGGLVAPLGLASLYWGIVSLLGG